MYWLDQCGLLHEPVDANSAGRPQPSVQLVGRCDERFDLGTVQDNGAVLTGRIVAVDGSRVMFEDDLAGTLASADAQMTHTLAAIDRYIDDSREVGGVPPGEPLPRITASPGPTWCDLRTAGIGTVVWATG